MSMKILDKAGLEYFWTKLKAVFAPAVHTQASNTVNAMTGYSKPSSTSAIASTDSLNDAVGKLEKALDGKQASGSYAAASHSHGSITNDGKLDTASRAVVTDGSKVIGVSSVTSTELGYLSGATSAVQTQLDGKVSKSGDTMTGNLTMNGNTKAFVVKNNTYTVYFQVGANGINRGLWDAYLNKWIVYANDSNAFLNGNASTSTKLATARSLKTKLDSTTAVTFDGSADQNEIPVTGTLPVENGGTGATSVSDVQERFFEPTPHHSASYDFDTFTASGIDAFASDTTLTNCPDGYNGILWTFGTEGMQKQFWSRTGTLDSNDHYIGFRSRYNGNWSGWHKIYTDSDTVPVANGGTGLTSLDTFVRTQDAQTVGGAKTFSNDATFLSAVIMAGNIRKNADNDELYVCGGSGGSNARGAYLRLKGVSASSNAGLFFLCTAKVNDSYANLNGYPNGTLTWNGQNIQTSSDERLKTPLSAVPDTVLDAWGDVQWGRFQYLDAVAQKGTSARLHLGLIAQKVKAVFEARGLDACQYGILCYDGEEDLWMVRYAEAAAMEACYQRRRADRLEARIAALEAKLP